MFASIRNTNPWKGNNRWNWTVLLWAATTVATAPPRPQGDELLECGDLPADLWSRVLAFLTPAEIARLAQTAISGSGLVASGRGLGHPTPSEIKQMRAVPRVPSLVQEDAEHMARVLAGHATPYLLGAGRVPKPGNLV